MPTLGSPQWAFLGSIVLYPTLHLCSLPKEPTFQRIAQSREALSIFHVTLQTILSAICLRQHKEALRSPKASISSVNLYPPLIATRSAFGQSITAIEAGYLLQDSFILLQAYKRRRRSVAGEPQLKGWSFLHLGLHHAILGTLMLVLQYFVYLETEKGILVIVAMHLMNASSIFGTARWFLVNSRSNRPKLLLATTAAYFATFAIFRVYLMGWLLHLYGQQRGPTIWQAINSLPVSCRFGSGTILTVNTYWLISGVKSFLLRLRKREKVKQ